MIKLIPFLALALLAACGEATRAPTVSTPPPACVAQSADAFAPERRPSVGTGPITDKTTARVLGQASRAIDSANARLAEQGALERARVANGCLADR